MKHWIHFALPILLVLCVLARADDDTPEAERQSFTVAEGFDVKLFACEKDGVVKPIQTRFDPTGRLWVVQSTVYPQIKPGEIPEDKVLVLDPPGSDGTCPRVHTFVGGLSIPTGIELGDDGVYVGAGTQLLFFKDSRGMDRPDARADEQRVVLSGFGTGDQHQTINSFSFGPGGELWMCQGLSIRSRVETPAGIVGLNQAGIWRFNPRRLTLEGFFGSQAEPQNPWGFVFTDFGEPIVIAGNNSSVIYPVPGLTSRHLDQNIPLIWKEGKGRKCSGGDIVENAHFPKDWQGTLIMGGYINNAVWAVKISDDGSGYALTDRTPLITSSSHSFRPVDVKFGPDGSLYICDWYNPIIGHYQASLRDPRRDKTHGRIWRVTAKGRPLTTPPQLVGTPVAQLLTSLDSRDRWTRQFTKRILANLPAEQVLPELKKYVLSDDRSDLSLTEALGVFQSHEAIEPALLTRLSAAGTSDARAYAASTIGTWADRLPDALDRLAKLIVDTDPRVRLQALVACSYVPDARAMQVAATAADNATDPFIDYAMKNVVFALKPYWLAGLKAGTLRFDKPAQLAMLVKADATPDVLAALRDVLKTTGDATSHLTLLKMLASVGDANDLGQMLDHADAATTAEIAPAIAEAAELRNVRPTGDVNARVSQMIASSDASARAAGLLLAAAWKTQGVHDVVEQLAGDAHQPLVVRQQAVRALPVLAPTDRAKPILASISGSGEPTLRVAAISALTMIDPADASKRAASFLSAGHNDADVADLFQSLLKRRDVLAPLAKALGAAHPTADSARIGVRLMNSAGVSDEALLAVLSEAAGFTRESRKLTEPQIADMAKEVRAKGDPAHGKEIFLRRELSCSSCHSISGVGGHIGPDLGAVGTAQTLEFIIGSIIYPNREVKEGYMSYEITMKNGDTYQAYLLHEDANHLSIHDIARDRDVTLSKNDVVSRVQHGSVMPNGLPDTLTQNEFRDLVAYLGSLGHAGK